MTDLSDYELALQLQFAEEADVDDPCADDFRLAQILSEPDDHRSGAPPVVTDSLRYSKIVVRSQHVEERTLSSKPLPVTSSAYSSACQQERKVQYLDDHQYKVLVKHDPLLNALSNSERLSELEGVGDLTGNGLLVNKTVSCSLRSFIQAQGKVSKRSSSKKTNISNQYSKNT